VPQPEQAARPSPLPPAPATPGGAVAPPPLAATEADDVEAQGALGPPVVAGAWPRSVAPALVGVRSSWSPPVADRAPPPLDSGRARTRSPHELGPAPLALLSGHDAGPLETLSARGASHTASGERAPRASAPGPWSAGHLSPGGHGARSALLALLAGHAGNGAVVVPLMLVLDLAVLLLVLGVPFARPRSTRVAEPFGRARLGHRAVALRPG
jgi:hypothetical protein